MKLLYAEGNTALRTDWALKWSDLGHAVTEVATAQALLDEYSKGGYELIITEMTGVDAIRQIRKDEVAQVTSPISIILLTDDIILEHVWRELRVWHVGKTRIHKVTSFLRTNGKSE